MNRIFDARGGARGAEPHDQSVLRFYQSLTTHPFGGQRRLLGPGSSAEVVGAAVAAASASGATAASVARELTDTTSLPRRCRKVPLPFSTRGAASAAAASGAASGTASGAALGAASSSSSPDSKGVSTG